MVTDWKRCFTVLAVCLSFGLAACNGNGGDEDAGGDTGVAPDGDVTGDTTADGGDTAPECIEDGDCAGGQVCESNSCVPAGCSSDEDCEEPNPICNQDAEQCVECLQDADCSEGEVCNDANECEVSDDVQCASVGDQCDPDGGPAGSGFSCVDIGTGGQCVNTCDPNASGQPCESGQLCLPASNSENPEYVCYTSQCTGPDDLDSCDQVDSHPLFPNSSEFKCVSLNNDADLCMPDGSKAAGETCTATSPVVGLFCQQGAPCEACQSGNACIGGTCRQICRSNPDDERYQCGDDSGSCVGANADDIVTGGAGFCGEQCEAYSRGQCSQEGQGCTALNNDVGYCTDVGDKGFMESCQPPTLSNPTVNECQEGMQCITFQSGGANRDTIARCVPICNPPAQNDNNRNDNDATCGGQMYGRFAYLGQDPSAVDVYLDGTREVNDLGTGAVSDADDSADGPQFFGFDPAELQIQVTAGSASDASNALIDTTPFLQSGQVRTWAVAVDANGDLTLHAVDVPVGVSAPSSGQAKIRVVHLVPDFTDADGNAVSVDVVAVPQDGSLGSDGVEVLTEADTGDAGNFTEIAPGTYDLHVFPQGATRDDGNQLTTVTGVDVAAGDFGSLYVTGTVASGDNADLGTSLVPYTSAPDAPAYTCWGQGQQSPDPASGLCLQECDVPGDYGQNSCYAEGNSCGPLGGGGRHFCAPSGDNEVGDACDPGGFRSCVEGATCAEYGDGSGVCHSYCYGGDESNPTLTCADSRSCTASEGSFGRCDPQCAPGDNYADQNCPEYLRTCFPESVSSEGDPQGAYCSPSHDKAEGEQCGGDSANRSVVLQNCQAGMFCTYDTATQQRPFIGQFFHRQGANPSCKQPCDPFAENPDCPDGQACGVDLAFANSSEVGVCMDQADVQSKATQTRCGGAAGQLCGDHSHCVIVGQGTRMCYEFCRWSDKSGCTDPTHECQPFATGPIGGLGICAPPQ